MAQKKTKPLPLSPDECPDHISTKIEKIDNGYLVHRTVGTGKGYHTSVMHSPDYPGPDISVGTPTQTKGSIVGDNSLKTAVRHLKRL